MKPDCDVKTFLFWAADQDKVGLLYSEVKTQSSQRLLEIMLVDQRHKLSFVWHRRAITPLGTLFKKKKFNIITDDSSGQKCSVAAFTAASKHVTEGPCNQRSTETVQTSTHTFVFFWPIPQRWVTYDSAVFGLMTARRYAWRGAPRRPLLSGQIAQSILTGLQFQLKGA